VDERCCRYHHIIYDDQDGLFYAIRGNGESHTIDLNGPSPLVNFILKPTISPVDNNKYIDFLQVWRYDRPIRKGEFRTIRLKVFMVDLADQKLVEMKNLNDHALFIGFNTPFFRSCEGISFFNAKLHLSDRRQHGLHL
jgi:hypothetical protein